jgi:hypothetical protein
MHVQQPLVGPCFISSARNPLDSNDSTCGLSCRIYAVTGTVQHPAIRHGIVTLELAPPCRRAWPLALVYLDACSAYLNVLYKNAACSHAHNEVDPLPRTVACDASQVLQISAHPAKLRALPADFLISARRAPDTRLRNDR